MMTNRLLPLLTVLLASTAVVPAVAQTYQSAPPSYGRDPGYPPGGYLPNDPRVTGALGDADEELDPRNAPVYSSRVAPPAPMNGLEDSRYTRTYGPPPGPAGAPQAYDRPQTYDRAPQGPVMSPDDPRYGRLGEPPAVIYSDRPQGPAPRDYTDRSYDDPYARGMRPPQPLGGSAPQEVYVPAQGVPAQAVPSQAAPQPQGGAPVPPAPMQLSALPPEERPEVGPAQLEPRFRRQEVAFATKEPAGTIVVDTPNTYLYYVLGNGRAVRYGIRVGRDGFRWNGVQKITRKAEWPDWHPPSEMIERQPYLPRFMAGGEGNPLGARAMYLGSTVYRIHGTNQPSTIGKTVSSGCFGMLNDDVSDLFERVKVGTRVVVMPGNPPPSSSVASAQPAPPPSASVQQVYNTPGSQPGQVAPLPPPQSIR